MGKNDFMLNFIGKLKMVTVLRKRPVIAIASLLLIIIFLNNPAFSQLIDEVPSVAPEAVSSASPIFHHYISKGMNLIFIDQYEEGLMIFDNLQQIIPDHPAPYFFKAAAYQNWMGSLRTNRFQEQFEENIQLTIEKGNKLLKRGNDPWLYFYVGAAYGYRAFNRVRKHDWMGAYFDAKKGVNKLKKALLIDPNLYDAYLGLGSYHYWRTSKSKFIRAIAFWITDKRELGLRQLEFSVEHGLYAKDQASYNLIAAYLDYGQYEEAMIILDHTIEKKNSFSMADLYYKARLLIKFERWPEAEFLFGEILQRLENHEFASVGYQVECKYWIAVALKEQNRLSQALRLTENALAQSKKRNIDLEIEGPIEDFREIKKRLVNLYRYLNTGETEPTILTDIRPIEQITAP